MRQAPPRHIKQHPFWPGPDGNCTRRIRVGRKMQICGQPWMASRHRVYQCDDCGQYRQSVDLLLIHQEKKHQ